MIQINEAPTSKSFSKIGNDDEIIYFKINDFLQNFNDRTKNGLKKIKIINLPDLGTLKLLNNTIIVNQEI